MIIKTRGQKKSWKPPSRGLGGHCRGSSSYGHGSVTLAHSEHVGCANQVLRHHWPRSNLWLVATHTHTHTYTQSTVLFRQRYTISYSFWMFSLGPLVQMHIKHFPWKHLHRYQQSRSIWAGKRPTTFILLFLSCSETTASSFLQQYREPPLSTYEDDNYLKESL